MRHEAEESVGDPSGDPGLESPRALRRPFLSCASAFSVGILFASEKNLAGNVFMALALSVLSFVLAARRRAAAFLVLPVAFLAAGLAAGALRRPPSETLSDTVSLGSEAVVIEGLVREAPGLSASRESLVVDLVGAAQGQGLPLVPVEGRARLRLPRSPGQAPCGEAGDRIRALAFVSRPETQRFPGGRSQSLALGRQGIALLAAGRHCLRVAHSEGSGILVGAAAVRSRVHGAIDAALPGATAGVVRAFATGDRSGIPPAIDESFRRSGLSHLLAVSGLNLAIVAGAFVLGLGFAFRFSARISNGVGARRLAAVVSLPFVAAYTLFVGASPSAVRAAIMVVALLLAHWVARRRDAWTALAVALVVMLAWDPATLGDVSFQLSFAAVAALLRVYPALFRLLPRSIARAPWILRAPMEVFVATAAVTVGTAPLVLRHFQQISWAGLVANLPAAPLASLLLVPLSLLGGLMAAMAPDLGAPILAVSGLCADALVWIAELSANLPMATMNVPTPSVFECLAFYGATIGLTVDPPAPRLRLFGVACLGLLGVSFLGSIAMRLSSQDTVITFLPVGQGDAVVIELPGDRTMLVDTGPGAEEGPSAVETVVLPFLRHRRIRSLDWVVLTHPHADHTGGLPDLLQGIRVEEIWWNGDLREGPKAFGEWVKDPRFRRVDVASAPLVSGGARVEILGPGESSGAFPLVNDRSVILKIVHGGRSVLLPGDAGSQAEAELVARCPSCVRTDVLKAGHHGSKTATSELFLEASRPGHLVISAGRRNRYGLPHAEALGRMKAVGAKVWSLSEHGAVSVRLEEGRLELDAHVDRSN